MELVAIICLFLVTIFSASQFSSAISQPTEIRDPFLLHFGPEHGDIFNTRERTCSEKPHPLGIDLKLGEETFGYAFVCKGGYIAFSKDKDSVQPMTTNMISTFWTEDVNANHWVNPFVDQLCSEIFDYQQSQDNDVTSFWYDQNVTFANYFSPNDIVYNNICNNDEYESSADIEELMKSENVRTMRWINAVYDLPSPSAHTTKHLTLTGNIFRRKDLSKDTLDVLTSFVGKVTPSMTFEATWSFVVTWFRTPLTRPWDGWLSQQTSIVCDEKKVSGEKAECYVIWFYEAAATAPCDDCQELPLPLETGFYVNGTLISLPSSLEGEANTTKLLSNSNIGVPGVYVFHLNDGSPEEPSYDSMTLYPCVRDINPKESDLFSDKVLFKMTGFFCDSTIPKSHEIEIVFRGTFSSKIVRPQRVDQLKGDIEALFPFWGVVEPVAVYLLVNGKPKPESTVQVHFVSLLDKFGLPPFIAIDELSTTEDIEHGWPEDFPFYSENLLIRSVVIKGAENVNGSDNVTAEGTELVVLKLLDDTLMLVKANNPVAGTSYKVVITAKEFKQLPKNGATVAQVPVILKGNTSCETWIKEQEKIDISHCLDRFLSSYCSGGLCVDYSCPVNASELVYDNSDITLEKLSWHDDPCCPFGGKNGLSSFSGMGVNGVCKPCEFTQGAAYCIESLSFPCRDGKDPTKKMFHISNKCCYTSDDVLIGHPPDGAGGILLHPGVRHDFARYYESEIDPWRACCGENAYNRTNGGIQETSCDAYHRLRPTIDPRTQFK